MKRPGRRFAAVGCVVCVWALTFACSSRSTPAVAPASPQPTQPSATPSPAASTPEPPLSSSAPTVPATSDLDCSLIAEPGDPITSVALTDRIDPSNAPRPSNDSERLLFRQLYETLIRVDCNGRIRPGLASSWRRDAEGPTWIVTLRENARFSDGTPVTPADVRASWTRDGIGNELQPQVSRLLQSIVAVDDRTLAITLRSLRVDAPVAFAHSDLAIAKRVPDSPWPLGTRSARIVPDGRTPVAKAATILTVARDNLSTIRFLVAAGDPRDLLDDGVDLLLTRDPAALGYATTLTQFQSVPLEWQRLYVLLAPGRSRSSPLLSDDARQVLADDAVRGEARGARGPWWWQMVPDCNVAGLKPAPYESAGLKPTPYESAGLKPAPYESAGPKPPPYDSTGLKPPPYDSAGPLRDGVLRSPARAQAFPTPRIVYDANDSAARDLADRLVGLARASGAAATAWLDALLPDRPKRTYQRSIGLTGEALISARRRGTDAAYVMSLDRRPIDACRDLQAIVDRTPWLDPETIVPLVETRLHAIVRRGRSGVTAEWDGSLLIAGVNDSK